MHLIPLILLAAGAAPSQTPSAAVSTWSLPAHERAAQPNLTVRDNSIWLSWVEPYGSGHRLRHAHDAGSGFAAPRDIAEGERWFVNWADFPSLVALPDGRFAAHLLQKSAEAPYAYDVRLLRSAGTERWSQPLTVHDDGTTTEHGFASIFPWSDGQLAIAWLDGRNTAGTGHGGHDAHGAGGAMTLRAAVFDADTKRSEWELDPRTCDCCQTDAALSAGGPLLVYRDRDESEVRDIAITRYRDGRWSTPQRVHADQWVMPGCPVNGPAIAARAAEVFVAWYTAAEQQPRLQLARSRDDGATFAAPLAVDSGNELLGRADLAIDAAHVFVSWLTESAEGQTLWLARYPIAADGPADRIAVARLGRGRATGFPRLAVRNAIAYLVWTDVVDGAPRLRGAQVDFAASRQQHESREIRPPDGAGPAAGAAGF